MEVGHEEHDARDLADRILDVATQRLVLLVADEEETVSFDVRSLQELMAARARAPTATTPRSAAI